MLSQAFYSIREVHNFHRFIKVVSLLLGVCFFLAVYYGMNFMISPRNLSEISNHRHYYDADDFVQVFVASEESHLDGTMALVNSIIKNTRKPVHFYFVTDVKSAEQLRSMIENSHLKMISYEIKIFTLSDLHFKNFTSAFEEEENKVSYSKLYISDLFPNIEGRLICLEDDMIVQGDIANLWNITIEPNHIGAFSRDCDTISKRYNRGLVKYSTILNIQNPYLKHIIINGEDCIFNLGVMVLNMSLWKEEGITQQLKHWYNLSKTENIFHVHSVLSPYLVVLYNRTSLLDNSWHVRHLGVTTGSRYSKEFLEKANLLHWDGRFKPWKKRSPYAELWQKYSLQKKKKSEDFKI